MSHRNINCLLRLNKSVASILSLWDLYIIIKVIFDILNDGQILYTFKLINYA